MELTSSAFVSRGPIPIENTGDGRDVPPPLTWSDVPQGTAQFALICDDPDAPSEEPWVHWLIYEIPGDWRALAEGIGAKDKAQPAGLAQGHNSWRSGQSSAIAVQHRRAGMGHTIITFDSLHWMNLCSCIPRRTKRS